MSGSRIRPVESAQIADLIRIADATNLNHWSATSYLDELKNEHSIMLRIESDENMTLGFIVGRIVPASDDDVALDAEIYNIGVDPSVQRNGYGQSLLDSFIEICREKRVRNIWLEVRESNVPALLIYRKNGFEANTIRKDFYSNPRENAILMCRQM